MKTIIACMLCAAALSFPATVDAQEAPTPSAVIPAQMTLTVSVDNTVSLALPNAGGTWLLAEQPSEDCPVDIRIDIVVAKDKATGAAIEGESDVLVSIKGKQEGKTSLIFSCVNDSGVAVASRTVAVEVVK